MATTSESIDLLSALYETLQQVVGLALNGNPDHQALLLLASQLKTAMAAGGGWILAAYFAVYTLLTALCLPGGSILMLVGGACMGFVECLLLSNAACALGAWMTFAGTRMGFTGLLQIKQARQGKASVGGQSSPETPQDSHAKKDWLQVIEARLANRQIPFLLSIRLAPIIPFAVFNILAAFTSLGHWRFLWTSFAGMLPGTWLYVNAGSQLGQVSSLQDLLGWEVLASVAALAVVPWVMQVHFNKQSLKQ